jgi:hypothetical protein
MCVCGRAGRVLFFLSLIEMWGARIAQSVYRLATGWTAKGPEFRSQYGQDSSPVHVVQTGSEARLASYPMDIRGSFS